MQSKTLCFNRALFKKNLTRFWPLWGGASALGALVPLTLLIELIRVRFQISDTPLTATASLYSALQFVPIFSLLFAVLCALAVWSYLFTARSVSLMHTLPITRKGIFVTNCLSGLAMMLIPYAVTGGLLILVFLMGGMFDPVGVLITILSVLGVSFFFFTTATFAAFCTGNMFAMPVLYGIFHCLAYVMEWMVTGFSSLFYYGTTGAMRNVTKILTPVYYMVDHLVYTTTDQTMTDLDGYMHNELTSVTFLGGGTVAMYALAGALLLAVCWLLYRSRRSESAGDVVAVGWMKPIFRYGVAFCAALPGGMGLYLLFWSGFQRQETADVLPMIVCMALAGVIGYYIASMLLAKSFRVFKPAWKGAAATAAAAAVLCLAVSLDPLGIEARLPEAGEVTGVYFSVGANGYCSGSTADPAVVQAVLDAHAVILAEREELQSRVSGYGNMAMRDHDDWVNVHFTYSLAGGGEIDRAYCFPITYAEAQQSGSAAAALAKLVTQPGIQRANILERYDFRIRESSEVHLTGGNVCGLYTPQHEGVSPISLTEAQSKTLYDAISRDIDAGHFGKTLFTADRDRLTYTADISLYYIYSYKADGPALGERTASLSISISSYCTETIRALEAMGIVDENSLLVSQETLDSWWNAEKSLDEEDEYFYGDSYPDEFYAYPEAGPVSQEIIGAADVQTAMLVTGG